MDHQKSYRLQIVIVKSISPRDLNSIVTNLEKIRNMKLKELVIFKERKEPSSRDRKLAQD